MTGEGGTRYGIGLPKPVSGDLRVDYELTGAPNLTDVLKLGVAPLPVSFKTVVPHHRHQPPNLR